MTFPFMLSLATLGTQAKRKPGRTKQSTRVLILNKRS